MKNKLNKNVIFSFVLGLVVMGSVGVGASYLYQSNQVGYKDGNVENSLNELFETNSIIKQGNADAADIMSGKTAIVNGKIITGTKADDSNHVYSLATSVNGSRTIDIKSLYPDDYTKFTNNNFVIKYKSTSVYVSSGRDPAEERTASASGSYSLDYNASTGSLSVNIPSVTARISGNTDLPATATIYADILLIK